MKFFGSFRANDDGLVYFAFLHRRFGGALLDVHSDDIAHASGVGDLAFTADHCGTAGAGVVGDFEDGAQLDHGGSPNW